MPADLGAGSVAQHLAIRSPQLALVPEPARSQGNLNIIEMLLREQQELTAVERFASQKQQGKLPKQAKYYKNLLPLATPNPGQQYAFEVDLDVCTGCKACVTACHNLNGLDDNEVWRTVGLLHGGTQEEPFQQTVTTSCHHCVDPACMNGCPVKAYEKDPITGIVKHLDDQCIGCQYCTLMCPYDAPKYSHSRGIVRKCDMCSDRLSQGEAPACVQACPNQAIAIKVVDQVQAIARAEAAAFLPGAPAPDHTLPTTVYKSAKNTPNNLLPADYYSVSAEHSHPPLVVMLVLTQLAVGAFCLDALLQGLAGRPFGVGASSETLNAVAALGLAAVALAAATFHLGRPLYAFRAVLGLKTSWMSREILGFGLFAKAGALYAATLFLPRLPGFPGKGLLAMLGPVFHWSAVGVGLFSVFCSAMIYAATRRAHWHFKVTGAKFLGTTVILGAAAVQLLSLIAGRVDALASPQAAFAGTRGSAALVVLVMIASGLKLAFEGRLYRQAKRPKLTTWQRVALMMKQDFPRATWLRFASGVVGGLFLPAIFLLSTRGGTSPLSLAPVIQAGLMFGLLLAGESIERFFFFAAAPGSRMPGGL